MPTVGTPCKRPSCQHEMHIRPYIKADYDREMEEIRRVNPSR